MKNKNTKVIGIIAAILPTLYALCMLLLPFLDFKQKVINAWGIEEIQVTHLKLFQLYNDSRTLWLLLFICPVVLCIVATLLCLIVQKKSAYIYETVATTFGSIFSLSALVLLQTIIQAIIENYAANNFGTAYAKIFLDTSTDITFSFGYGFWLALFFVIAALVMSLITIKLINDEQGEPAPAPNPQPGPGPRPAPSPSPRPAGAHQIVCISGEFANASFPINPGETVVIGRDSAASNIVIVAPKVSRKHCTITFDASKNMFIVVDCSTNGTFTENGTRLMANMNNPLPSGTVISLGSNENRFRLV